MMMRMPEMVAYRLQTMTESLSGVRSLLVDANPKTLPSGNHIHTSVLKCVVDHTSKQEKGDVHLRSIPPPGSYRAEVS